MCMGIGDNTSKGITTKMPVKLIDQCLAVSVRTIAAITLVFHAVTSPAQELFPAFDDALIRSEDWHERREGFANLLGLDDNPTAGLGHVPSTLQKVLDEKPALRDQRTLALIALLESENEYRATFERSRIERGLIVLPVEERMTDDYSTYYGDLVGAVSYIKDIRGLQALLGAIDTGGMVRDALASFGLAAVEPVAGLLDSDSEITRASSTLALLSMFEQSAEISTSAIGRESVKRAAFRAALDNSPIVRRSAVGILARLGDVNSIAVLEDLAKKDPYRADYRDGSPYIVREAAIEALATLR